MTTDKTAKDSETVLVSRQKWIIIGLIITIVNPFFAGLIYGWALWREKDLKKEGKWIMILSLLWGAIQAALLMRYY